MKVTITHVYGDHQDAYQGDDESVRKKLIARYPNIVRNTDSTLKDIILRLSQVQSLIVNVE